jgi:hypothetical protein
MIFEKGKKLFYVPKYGSPYFETIIKAGRVYLYTERRDKILLSAFETYGYADTVSGRYYPSEKKFREVQAFGKAWSEFWKELDRVRWNPPKDLTPDRIRQAAELLGLKLEGLEP